MNWEAAGTIVEGIGVIAVVAALFYVGVQIRQSTAQARRAEMNANLEQASLFRLARRGKSRSRGTMGRGVE